MLDSNAISIQYTDEGILGNHIIGSGSSASGANAIRNASDILSQAQFRRIDVASDFGTVLSQAALGRATTNELKLTVTEATRVYRAGRPTRGELLGAG